MSLAFCCFVEFSLIVCAIWKIVTSKDPHEIIRYTSIGIASTIIFIGILSRLGVI